MLSLLHLSDRVPPVAKKKRAGAPPTQFRLLVRHLLQRFFNNETISAGGEPLPLIMTTACAIAMPTFVLTILLFPAYHAYPPRPPVPTFWEQAGHHYFFVLYSLVAMGAITVFEADLLFPNLLDIFILSSLPIPAARLRRARITAVVLFLVLFLFGVNSLGILAFPLVTENPLIHRMDIPALFRAHLAAVTCAGAFAAAVFLALQGVLLCTLGARLYRLASTLLQGAAIAVLLTMLLSYLTVFHSLEGLIRSGSPLVRCFPPFWFLGVYETILAGPSALPAFTQLAETAYRATSLAVLVAVATYPLAYRRRTRQVIEGMAATQRGRSMHRPLRALLHTTLLRTPARRAIFHFIGQSLRSDRHRIYLAMYAGLGAALLTVCALTLQVEPHRIYLAVSTKGLRLAIPGLAFWTVAGLCTALDSTADPAAGWIFRTINGRPTANQLAAVRTWVGAWGMLTTLAAVAALQLATPPGSRSLEEAISQAIVGAGLCLVLTDAFLLQRTTLPFTESRLPRNTDLAFILLRYIVIFPALVLGIVQVEPWIEAGAPHLILTALIFAAAHLLLRHASMRTHSADRSEIDEPDGLIHTLGLRES